MYADPTHIRDHVVKVRLNDAEARLLEALAEFNHAQPAAFARELLLEQLARIEPADEQEDAHDIDRAHAALDRRRSGGPQAGTP